MKTNPRSGHAAFSLVELLTVIAIIAILAALTISGMGFVQDYQARKKAQIQIQMLSKALEDYKLDYGSYPATTDSADGSGNSQILFKALYNDGANDTTKKIYISELDPVNNKQGWTTGVASDSTKITDPWGSEYRYRSAFNSASKANTNTRNPDFDLWSCGKDGKTSNDASNSFAKDDIWNK